MLDEAAVGVVGMGRLDEQVEALAEIGNGLGPARRIEVPGVESFEQQVTDLAWSAPGPGRLLLDHLVAASQEVSDAGSVRRLLRSGCSRPAVTDDGAGVVGRSSHGRRHTGSTASASGWRTGRRARRPDAPPWPWAGRWAPVQTADRVLRQRAHLGLARVPVPHQGAPMADEPATEQHRHDDLHERLEHLDRRIEALEAALKAQAEGGPGPHFYGPTPTRTTRP